MTTANYTPIYAVICTDYGRTNPVYVSVDSANTTISMVENYGQTGRTTVYNKTDDPTKNLLSPQCTLWSDGQPRALDQNMFIRLFTGEYPTSETSFGVFKITTITASEDSLTIEFCDSLQLLRAQGADYVYNHFNGGYSWHDSYLRWDDTLNKAYVEKDPYQPLIGGDDNDVRVYYEGNSRHVNNDQQMEMIGGDWIYCYVPRSAYYGDYITKITDFRFNGFAPTHSTYRIHIGREKGGSEIIKDDFQETSNFGRDEIFSKPEYLPTGFWISINCDHAIPVRVDYGNCDGATCGERSDRAFRMTIFVQTLFKNVVGSEDSSNPAHWLVSSIGGNTPEKSKIKSFKGSAQIYQAETSSPMKNTEIMDWVLKAAEMKSDILDGCPSRDVWVFRCNGDYYHNYLLALADFPSEDTNTQLCMFADNMEWGLIIIRSRFKNDLPTTSDEALKKLRYARDDVSDADVFLSFNPSISLKNRPSLAVVKSSDESEHPIMIALPDLNVPVGASQPIVSTHSTLTIDAAVEAYSAIMTNRSKKWDGEMKLSGIHKEYFKTDGDTCGGIPIEITDHRYGFTDYKAKVKEIEWDFDNQTTTLTINNYSEMYSNGLIDTAKMAYVAGGLSSEASNKDMFVRQFISIVSEGTMPDTVTSVTIASKTADLYTATGDVITSVKFPELGVGVVNAYIAPKFGSTDERHGVHRVKVNNGAYITIPEAKRPDKSQSQSLIVNVIYRLT